MELGFFTEIWYDPPKCQGCKDGCGNEQPTPGMSFIEFDINKNTTDILGLYRYLGAKVYKNVQMTSDEGLHAAILEPSPQGAMEKFLNFFGQDMVQLDPQQLQQSLSLGSEVPVLGFDEMVCPIVISNLKWHFTSQFIFL